MMPPRPAYALGIDFGTESARALLVDCTDGREVACSTHTYENGVVDERLPAPDDDVLLGPDWALQDPRDYLRTLQVAVPAVLREAEVPAADVIGIGIDFTSCTMLPTLRDGTPLCLVDGLRREPHAWVKLWKHHAAQPQADRVNAVAEQRSEPWLARYGGRISSEWFFPKALQILDEAPGVYARSERLIEAADWIVWQLTGAETRNSCTAGYKAMWSRHEGFPSRRFLAALDPRFADVIDEKMSRDVLPPGACAGGLRPEAAAWTGLLPGTPVAVANVDAHVSAPAVTVTEPGTLVTILGTSNCLIVLDATFHKVEGMCGAVEDGVIPGLIGYEAGQSGVGDILAWFVEQAVPPRYYDEARRRGLSVHDVLAADASRLRPGQGGVLALDWWNGNRSVLVDADLSGLLVGMTLKTRPPDLYRALVEATAFGMRVILEAFERAGVACTRIVACGGLPHRNRWLMQVYADVLNREIVVARSEQVPALGSAMFGAVAAGARRGGYESIVDAARNMAHLSDMRYTPNPAHRKAYDTLYHQYLRLHDLFGRDRGFTMQQLRRLRSSAAMPMGSA